MPKIPIHFKQLPSKTWRLEITDEDVRSVMGFRRTELELSPSLWDEIQLV